MVDDSEALIHSASRGEEAALLALLERHLPDLRAYVRLRAGRDIRAKESCSDIVQSVCREVLEDLDGFEFRGEPAFRAWLFKHTLNKIVDRARYYDAGKREAGREEPLPETDGSAFVPAAYASLCTPSQVAMAHELKDRIEAGFDELPEDYREVLVLSRIVGLSHGEIAEETGRTLSSVRNLVYRGMARLTMLVGETESKG